jgi:hypothetical protein
LRLGLLYTQLRIYVIQADDRLATPYIGAHFGAYENNLTRHRRRNVRLLVAS